MAKSYHISLKIWTIKKWFDIKIFLMIQALFMIPLPAVGFTLQTLPLYYPLHQRVQSTTLKMFSSFVGTACLIFTTTKAHQFAAVISLPAATISLIRLFMNKPFVRLEDSKYKWVRLAIATTVVAGLKSPLFMASSNQWDSCISILCGYCTSIIGFVLEREIARRLAAPNYQDIEFTLEEIRISSAPAA